MMIALLLLLDLKAGFGSADITPEPGAQMPGGFRVNLSKGVRDPLYAVACVVSDGTTPVALVGIDALFVGKHTVKEAREIIQKATGIPGANVLVGASHTHTGGPILSCLGSDEDPAYSSRVAKAIAKAVEDAWKSAKTVELAVGVGKEDTIAHNRRFLMKDGREITHPGKPGSKMHDQIVRPAAPMDPDVGVLAARANGAITGLVVHYTCHVTVIGGSGYSADYPGFLRKHLKARYGEAVEVVFLNGCCGDITQVDNRSTARESGPEHADLMGQKLAAEATRALNRATWMKDAATGASSETLKLAIRAEPDVERERPPFGLGTGQDDVYEKERKHVADERSRGPVDAEVQGLKVGPLGIATTGAEWFVEHGLKIKAASPHATTWVVGYANDYIGYVPTANAMVAGGYECRTARSSKLAIDAGQLLVEGCLRQLNRVK